MAPALQVFFSDTLLALAGIEPSVGSVGDSYDNAPLGRLLCNRLSGNAWPKR
jgi:hypothetical protein